MAALFFRAFWPDRGPSALTGIVAIGLYAWLGMAMSGPIALIRHRPPPSGPAEPGVCFTPTSPYYTWAELAWLLIGTYWIVIELFVIRSRLPEFSVTDMAVFGLVPFALALTSRVFQLRPHTPQVATHAWTHKTAVVLLMTWPLAWLALILLGHGLR